MFNEQDAIGALESDNELFHLRDFEESADVGDSQLFLGIKFDESFGGDPCCSQCLSFGQPGFEGLAVSPGCGLGTYMVGS